MGAEFDFRGRYFREEFDSVPEPDLNFEDGVAVDVAFEEADLGLIEKFNNTLHGLVHVVQQLLR